MALSSTLALQEQDTAELHRYIEHVEHLQSIVKQAQTALRERKLGGETAFATSFPELTPHSLTASQEQFRENPYKTILDDQLDPICRFQADFRLIFVNQSFAALYGKTPQELIGENLLNVVQPQYQEYIRSKVALLNAQNPLTVHESLLQLPDGSMRWYQSTTRRLEYADGAIEYQAVARDITELKQAEESEGKRAQFAIQQTTQTQNELSELKSSFITNTSHEFRTPLAIILSTAEILLAWRYKLTDTQIEQRLTRIVDQVQHIKTLLEDMLDLARIQARRINFAPTPYDPALLCQDLITEYKNLFEVTRQLVYICDANPPMADLDKRLLRHILYNLIANAVKYSADDKPVVVRLAYQDAALILTVSDKGIGIPAADIHHLFQSFYRATNSRNIPGAGLGLSIVKETVELHRGSIAVESQVGIGSTFTVTIPLAASGNGL